MRGLAVLGVIAVHTPAHVPGTEGWLAWGARGVQLFFFISAFTLMTSDARRHEPVTFFFIRRFFRIAPMFYAATLFYAVTGGRATDIAGMAATLSLFFGLTPWTLASVIVIGGWSIGAEVLFYTVFPFVARRSTALTCVAGILILAMAGDLTTINFASFMMPPASAPVDVRSAWWIWYKVATWSTALPAGMLFYHLMQSAKTSRAPKIEARHLEIILVIVLLYLAHRLNDGDDIVPIVLVFVPMAFCFAMGAGRWIVTRPMCWIGKVSFSCYLIHFAVLGTAHQIAALLPVGPRAPMLACTFLIGTALTVAASSITYLLIERPFMRLGENLIRRIAARSVKHVSSNVEVLASNSQ